MDNLQSQHVELLYDNKHNRQLGHHDRYIMGQGVLILSKHMVSLSFFGRISCCSCLCFNFLLVSL